MKKDFVQASRVPLKGWDVLRITTGKKGKAKMTKSFSKTNPLKTPKKVNGFEKAMASAMKKPKA